MHFIRLSLLTSILMWPGLVHSQVSPDFKPAGSGSGVIYANFHRGISEASLSDAAFELVRAYLGYEQAISPEFSARITLDIGSPDDVSPFSKLRRYAYFKYAYAQYEKQNLTVQFGLIGTLQYKLQEKIWERRYLKKAFADEFKLGPSADLGASLVYRFNSNLTADLTMMNGEGYTKLQMDDNFKYAAGMTLSLPKSLVNRFYIDYMMEEIAQSTFTWVSSYTFREKVNLTFEYNHQFNSGLRKNQALYGYSMYGKYDLGRQYQLFARYDILRSNILPGEVSPWHLVEDGSMVIAGIQFSPVKAIKMALNYQDWVPWAANLPTRSFIYIDMEIKL